MSNTKAQALRIGFVGAGFIAKFHAKALLNVRNVTVDGVVSRADVAEFQKFCAENELGPARHYKTIQEMCQHVDVVAIYAPNEFRIAMVEEIANARKAGAPVRGVVSEKPLGRTLKEAKLITETCKKGGLLTAYFENQIYMNTVQAQRNQLHPVAEKMGSLSLVRSSEEHGGPHNAWFWDPTKQGGGVLSDMGCHSIAVGWYMLTPHGESLDFLKPVSVSCELACLKWGSKPWSDVLMKKYGVDFAKHPAEDFATGVVTFQNPKTKQLVKAQFTDSWMYEKQGLRLLMDGTGPGYAFEINTLISPLQIFISDDAAEKTANSELALEKSTSTRGLLTVQANEADLYGYTTENQDMVTSFRNDKDALLNFDFGCEITKLIMAAYMSSEKRKTIDLTDPAVLKELENYVPLIQQGHGRDVLFQ